MPEIKWEESEVTIPEGENRQVCFNSSIGTARPYDVRVDIRGKGANPATRGISQNFSTNLGIENVTL